MATPQNNPTLLASLRHQLVVSVQADVGEPFYNMDALGAMMQAVVNGGAKGLRLANAPSIQWAKAHFTDLPVIGITKPEPIPANFRELVYITPTWDDIVSITEAGADIIAIDGTQRPRPYGETLAATVQRFKTTYPDRLLMADIATVEEAVYCESLGVDLVATTLCGYTQETLDAPDNFDLLHKLREAIKTPIVMEGRLNTPADVKRALAEGAFTVVVGSAITRPHLITQQFVSACL